MKILALCLLSIALIGCNKTAPPPEVEPGISEAQLVPTLQKIAETGEYNDVLQDLTIGLENGGHMEEAVMVQSFQEQSDPEDVKKLAAKVVKRIQK